MTRGQALSGALVVLGAQESGTGAAVLAKKRGLPVFVSDAGRIKENYRNVLIEHDIEFEEGGHSAARVLSAGEIVKSPGIPDSASLVRAVTEKNIPVISEIEFASRFTKGTIVGITGSNGKTTTTLLTGHILKKAGLDVAVGGNVGTSFASLVAERDRPLYVLELSSFQLDGIREFRPHIAILTNITPDHLDRYAYRMSKAALNAGGKSLALDLAPRGVHVAILHPGFVRTRMTGHQGLIDPAESARLLVERIDALDASTSGTFFHADGSVLPW